MRGRILLILVLDFICFCAAIAQGQSLHSRRDAQFLHKQLLIINPPDKPMKFLFATVLSLAILPGMAVGQDSYSAQLVKVLPQSPNAATLLQFLDAPVGYYTGIP